MRVRRSKSGLSSSCAARVRLRQPDVDERARRGRASRDPARPSPGGRRRRRRSRAARPRRCASRRSASPPRASARRGRSRRSPPRRAIRAPWIADSPTAPQPITPTRAPSQTCAVLSTEQTPVATAQPIRHACSAGKLVRDGIAADSCTTVRVANVPSWSVWNSFSPPARSRRRGARRRAAAALVAARAPAALAARRAPAEHDALADATAPRRRRPPRRRRRPRDRAAPAADARSPSRATCRSVWQTPVASMRTSTSPGPRLVELELLEREPAELGDYDAAIHVASSSATPRAPSSASVRSVSAANCSSTARTPS